MIAGLMWDGRIRHYLLLVSQIDPDLSLSSQNHAIKVYFGVLVFGFGVMAMR